MSFKKHGESEIIGKPIEIKDNDEHLTKEKTEESSSEEKD